MAKVKVYISPKKGILDPQGKAVESALKSLGYKKVSNVRIGRYVEFEMTDDRRLTTERQIDEMCKKLLANPIIEDFRFEVCE
jgi:phosphoribosylformylglycinamidine synthase